jgi:cysteine-rich repeat protein
MAEAAKRKEWLSEEGMVDPGGPGAFPGGFGVLSQQREVHVSGPLTIGSRIRRGTLMKSKSWLPILGIGLLLLATVGCSDDEVTYLPLCGNGLVDDKELCDDGNNVDGDGCSKFCTFDITGVYPISGTISDPNECGLGSAGFEITVAHSGFDATLENPLLADLEVVASPVVSSTVASFYERDPVLSGSAENQYFFSDGVCLGGGNDGEACQGDEFCTLGGTCVIGICEGGANDGKACSSDDGCPSSDGVCTDSVCVGGDLEGSECEEDVDCEGVDGTCKVYACGITVQEDWTLVFDETNTIIADSSFTLTLGDTPEGCWANLGEQPEVPAVVPCTSVWDVVSAEPER